MAQVSGTGRKFFRPDLAEYLLPILQPDFDHYLKLPAWTPWELVCLLVRYNPYPRGRTKRTTPTITILDGDEYDEILVSCTPSVETTTDRDRVEVRHIEQTKERIEWHTAMLDANNERLGLLCKVATAARDAMLTGRLKRIRLPVRVATAESDEDRNREFLIRPIDGVRWALTMEDDIFKVPEELRAFAGQHEVPTAHANDTEGRTQGQGGNGAGTKKASNEKHTAKIEPSKGNTSDTIPRFEPDLSSNLWTDLRLQFVNDYEFEVWIRGKLVKNIKPEDMGLLPERGARENMTWVMLRVFADRTGRLPKRKQTRRPKGEELNGVQDGETRLRVKLPPIDGKVRRRVQLLRVALRAYFGIPGDPIDSTDRSAWLLTFTVLPVGTPRM